MKRLKVIRNHYCDRIEHKIMIDKVLAWVIIGLVIGLVVTVGIAWATQAEAGMLCKYGGVYQDSSKAEVLQKCGPPIYVQKEGWEFSANEVWTYNDRGVYRYLHFRGNKLDWIENGSLVR